MVSRWPKFNYFRNDKIITKWMWSYWILVAIIQRLRVIFRALNKNHVVWTFIIFIGNRTFLFIFYFASAFLCAKQQQQQKSDLIFRQTKKKEQKKNIHRVNKQFFFFFGKSYICNTFFCKFIIIHLLSSGKGKNMRKNTKFTTKTSKRQKLKKSKNNKN